MGSSQSKDKMHCSRYLNGKGPPALTDIQSNGTNNNKIGTLIKQGNQPEGQMTWILERKSLPGHSDCDTIQIAFHFEAGIQSDIHPHPGHRYKGLDSVAYLPNNNTGVKILRLLEVAFQHKMMFTVVADLSGEYCVTPADIPLKTMDRGPESSGYPDPNYLKTVTKVLKQKRIK